MDGGLVSAYTPLTEAGVSSTRAAGRGSDTDFVAQRLKHGGNPNPYPTNASASSTSSDGSAAGGSGGGGSGGRGHQRADSGSSVVGPDAPPRPQYASPLRDDAGRAEAARRAAAAAEGSAFPFFAPPPPPPPGDPVTGERVRASGQQFVLQCVLFLTAPAVAIVWLVIPDAPFTLYVCVKVTALGAVAGAVHWSLTALLPEHVLEAQAPLWTRVPLALLYLVLVPVFAIILFAIPDEGYKHLDRALFNVFVAVMAATAVLTAVYAARDAWAVVRVCGAFVCLALQLAFGLLFGAAISHFPGWLALCCCALYPVCIALLFRTPALLLLRPLQHAPLGVTVQLVSSVLAAVPYRVVFLSFTDWALFAALLCVEAAYKVAAYPLMARLQRQRLDAARERELRVQALIPAAGLSHVPGLDSIHVTGDSNGDGDGGGDDSGSAASQWGDSASNASDDDAARQRRRPKPSVAQREFEWRLFLQTFVDVSSAIGIALVLQYLFGAQQSSPLMAAFTYSTWHVELARYCVGAVWSTAIAVPLAWGVRKSFPSFDAFGYGQPLLAQNTAALYTATIAAYLFSALYAGNRPNPSL